MGVRIELIPIKDIFGNGGEGILIGLLIFLLNVIIVFVVLIVLVVEIGTIRVVTEAFFTASALVVVAVHMLEVDAAGGNHSDFF